MSMTINNQEDFHRVQRLVWGKLFGIFIKKGREKGAVRWRRRPAWPGWNRLNGGCRSRRCAGDSRAVTLDGRSPRVQQGAAGHSGPDLPGCLGGRALPCRHPGPSGYWRRVLTIPYAHLQREEVRE